MRAFVTSAALVLASSSLSHAQLPITSCSYQWNQCSSNATFARSSCNNNCEQQYPAGSPQLTSCKNTCTSNFNSAMNQCNSNQTACMAALDQQHGMGVSRAVSPVWRSDVSSLRDQTVKRFFVFTSIFCLVVAGSCARTVRSQRIVHVISRSPELESKHSLLSDRVRRELAGRLRHSEKSAATVSLDLDWQSAPAQSQPGPWIDEPCLPQPGGAQDTPPVLTDSCGKLRGTSTTRTVIIVIARVQTGGCKSTIGPLRGTEREVVRELTNRIAGAVASVDRATRCDEAGWTVTPPDTSR